MATSKIDYLPKVVESGTSGMWTYRKWSDGTAECWGIVSKTTNFAVWAAPIYYGTTYTGNQAYPTNLFISEPVVTALMQHGGGADVWLGLDSQNPANNTRSPSFYPLRLNTTGQATYKVGIHAIGKWRQE